MKCQFTITYTFVCCVSVKFTICQTRIIFFAGTLNELIFFVTNPSEQPILGDQFNSDVL